jgi:hypothetical protein
MADTRYQILSDKILEKLQGISKLSLVLDYPVLEFNSYPAAFFVPSEGESQWETNADDERVYAWEIFIYYEIEPDGIRNALRALFDCIDDVLDSFAQDRQLNDGGVGVQTALTNNGYSTDTMITTEPVAAGWEEDSDKKVLRAKINLRVRLTISNT